MRYGAEGDTSRRREEERLNGGRLVDARVDACFRRSTQNMRWVGAGIVGVGVAAGRGVRSTAVWVRRDAEDTSHVHAGARRPFGTQPKPATSVASAYMREERGARKQRRTINSRGALCALRA